MADPIEAAAIASLPVGHRIPASGDQPERVVVPVEPTEEMFRAAGNALGFAVRAEVQTMYCAMLAACMQEAA